VLRSLIAPGVLLTCLVTQPVRAQGPAVAEWLSDYAAGRHAEVAQRLKSVVSLKQLERDLEATASKWLEGSPGAPELRRRALVAFVLEAVYARIDQGTEATRLLETACRRIRRHATPDEFDRRWHLAAFAMFAGAVDPDALEAHVAHMRFHFPQEPRLPLERAVASELRAAPFFVQPRIAAAEITKRYEDAARRYREAVTSSDPATRSEAQLRLGRVELELGRPAVALEVLAGLDGSAGDAELRYLSQLFRGMALERLGRTDEARAAYHSALNVVPTAQSASMALAALHFRQGQREAAERLVSGVLGIPEPQDPWWIYWPADFRRAPALIAAVREAVQ
jgi:tetratricopeptide (TPR) repeat protein